MSVVIYNNTKEQRTYHVYLNEDESKSVALNGLNGVVSAGSYAIVDVSQSWIQVIIETDDATINEEFGRGYLVTDLPTSGANAWVYLGGHTGAWDFRAGGGHKYRAAVKARGGVAYHWTDATKTMSWPIKGQGDGAQTPSDTWPPASSLRPVRNQPPESVAPVTPSPDPGITPGEAPVEPWRHVIAGRNGTIYRIKSGKLYRHHHLGFADGSASWGPAVEISGGGWGDFRSVMAGNDGVLYVIRRDGKLLWYQDLGQADGSARWANSGNPIEIGSNWHNFVRVTAGDDGVLYALNTAGDLVWYRHTPHASIAATGKADWSNPRTAGTGWQGMDWIGASGGGLIYSRSNGDLYFHRHLGHEDGSQSWTPSPLVSKGWGGFRAIAASNDRVIYAVDAAGNLDWYRELADGAGSWNQVMGIAQGWGP